VINFVSYLPFFQQPTGGKSLIETGTFKEIRHFQTFQNSSLMLRSEAGKSYDFK
jgi:hypothetical protein